MRDEIDNKILEDLKWNYNYFLERYNNGCKYIEEHPKQESKWLSKLTDILDNLVITLDEIKKHIDVSDHEILNGFELKGENNYGID